DEARVGTLVVLSAGRDARVAIVKRALVPAHSVRIRVVRTELHDFEDAPVARVHAVDDAVVREQTPDRSSVPTEPVRAPERDRELVKHLAAGIHARDRLAGEGRHPERVLRPEEAVHSAAARNGPARRGLSTPGIDLDDLTRGGVGRPSGTADRFTV